MATARSLFLTLLVVGVAACGDEQAAQHAQEEAADKRFATLAERLYAELDGVPLDSTLHTEIGLFGDIPADSSESVVMRRYRYRVDSAEFGPVAYMAFQIRVPAGQHDPIPVVLSFVSRERVWHLERTEYGTAVSDSTEDATLPGTPTLADDPPTPLHANLRARIDAWLDAALVRARSTADAG